MEPNPLEPLGKRSAQRQHDLLHLETHAIATSIVSTFARTSPIFERVSTWLLGVAGAAIALLVPNIEDVNAALGVGATRWSLILLALSVVAGVIAKVLGLMVEIHREVTEHFPGVLQAVINEYDAAHEQVRIETPQQVFKQPKRADFNEVNGYIIDNAPWFIRWQLKRGVHRGSRDWLWSHKKTFRRLMWQSAWTVVQLLTFVLFSALAAFRF